MADQTVKLDLDPKKIIQALDDAAEEMKNLARITEDSLGKEAPKSIDKMEKAAENGSSKIATHFRNLGTRIKQDLKTAFDATSILGGLKFAKELGEGIKGVFDLEKAFDKLNTRLQLTGKTFSDFKKDVGTKVSATGQKLEDIFPGVEAAASKGGVKSPQELSLIGEALGKVRAATGENTEALTESIVEILKTQGKKVTAQSFKQTLDTLQATRVTGAFGTAGEAGAAIQQLSPYAKQLGLGTRELGALSATASKSGESGQNILQQLFQRATQPGQMQALNSIFGVNLFKNGKLDSSQIGKINTEKFGQYSPQILEQATGLQGASGGDLKRFVESFRTGMKDYDKVLKGSNETANQFKVATNNLASGIDQFKEKTKNASREVGESLSSAANEMLKGNVKGAIEGLKGAGKSAFENKGTIAAALGATAGASLLLGQGIGSLLKKVPGAGALGGVLGGEAAKAAGIQPVYVTNASEIGAAAGGGGAGGVLSKFGVAGSVASAGLAAGSLVANTDIGKKLGKLLDPVLDQVADAFDVGGVASAKKSLSEAQNKSQKQLGGPGVGTEHLAEAVAKGTEQGMARAKKNQPTQYTNPSTLSGRGGHL